MFMRLSLQNKYEKKPFTVHSANGRTTGTEEEYFKCVELDCAYIYRNYYANCM